MKLNIDVRQALEELQRIYTQRDNISVKLGKFNGASIVKVYTNKTVGRALKLPKDYNGKYIIGSISTNGNADTLKQDTDEIVQVLNEKYNLSLSTSEQLL